jgi:hypothetical protein
VCFTTDGSTPELRNGQCTGATTARLPANHRIRSSAAADTSATSIHGVKLAFDWPASDGVSVQSVAGNFTLDCTQPEPDSDGDGVPNNMDNCPMPRPTRIRPTPTCNMIGDVCEAMGAPDADRDGRPDAADNCPRVWNVNQGGRRPRRRSATCATPTPRGEQALPWTNGTIARAFVAWKDELQCSLNGCRNPGGTGSWRGDCEHGGTVDWNVSLSGLRAISTFTYRNCDNSVTVPVHDYMRDPRGTDPDGDAHDGRSPLGQRELHAGHGLQRQRVRERNGDGHRAPSPGTAVSHIQIRDSNRAPGGYFSHRVLDGPDRAGDVRPQEISW